MSDIEIAHDPESRRYIWLDAAGVRCSPRHIKLPAAIQYKRNWEPEGKTQLFTGGRGSERVDAVSSRGLPSYEEPVKLVVIYEIVRELTEEEGVGAKQLENMIAKGWV